MKRRERVLAASERRETDWIPVGLKATDDVPIANILALFDHVGNLRKEGKSMRGSRDPASHPAAGLRPRVCP
jgi:hypothetical protein